MTFWKVDTNSPEKIQNKEDSITRKAQGIISYLLTCQLPPISGETVKMTSGILSLLELIKNPLDKYTILSILQTMAERKLATVDDFYKIFLEEEGHEKSQGTRNWRFYIPVDIVFVGNMEIPFEIRISNNDMKFLLLKDIDGSDKDIIMQKLLENDKFTSKYGKYKEENQVYLQVSSRNFHAQNAWAEVISSFDILRGIIEFSMGSHDRRRDLDGPRHIIRSPRIRICIADGVSQDDRFLAAQQRDDEYIVIDQKNIDSIIEFSRPFKNLIAPNSIIELCAESLRLYAQAMDGAFPYNCLLGLWQMAEAMTIAVDQGGKTDEVKRRLKILIGNIFEDFACDEVLSRFAGKRNKAVHSGINDSITEGDVTVLAYICREAFTNLMSIGHEITTIAHLGYYYTYFNRDKLPELGETIQYIARRKKKPSR